MERKELCCCGGVKKHLPHCPLDEVGVDSSDIADIERVRKELKKLVNKKICSCALVNGHLLNCPQKNLTRGEKLLEIDFSALGKMFKEMEKRVSEEDTSPDGRKTKIFVAPVLKKAKSPRKNRK